MMCFMKNIFLHGHVYKQFKHSTQLCSNCVVFLTHMEAACYTNARSAEWGCHRQWCNALLTANNLTSFANDSCYGIQSSSMFYTANTTNLFDIYFFYFLPLAYTLTWLQCSVHFDTHFYTYITCKVQRLNMGFNSHPIKSSAKTFPSSTDYKHTNREHIQNVKNI